MKTITLKLTDAETKLLGTQRGLGNVQQVEVDGNTHIIEVLNVDKFREFLNDEIDPHGFGRGNVDRITYRNLKSILSKLDKAVVLNNLQKQIVNKEGLEGLLDEITEACSYAESDGQFYNGIRINDDTILVLMSYWDKHTTLTEYFHYSISKNELVQVDAEMDMKYRDLFEDCDMLDSFDNCFYIVGIEPTKEDKAKIVYGDEYNDTIVNLDVVQNDEPKSFKTEEELVKYLRSTGDDEYNDASDQYILDEAWKDGVWEEDDKGGYRLVQNNEPKCTKCGSKFEDEIWKTDGLEYEDYICSNTKCCAVHRINIERLDDGDGYPKDYCDVERDWKSLEFSYIWEQGLKNDEPKGDIGVWDIKFYREDDEGNQTLYEYNGDCSVFSDIVDEDDLTEIK